MHFGAGKPTMLYIRQVGILLLILTSTACSAENFDKKLIGKWHVVYTSGDRAWNRTQHDFYLIFEDNGNFEVRSDWHRTFTKWKSEDGFLIIEPSGPLPKRCKYEIETRIGKEILFTSGCNLEGRGRSGSEFARG